MERGKFMDQNINTVLLNHFTTGGGTAAYLRRIIPELPVYVKNFFMTRSDIQRIQKAEELAGKILSISDFDDLIPLRDEVATLEIKRLINYEKQTDHTAHTVYLFLLGIWIYDNVPVLRESIDKKIPSSKHIKMFVFQWTFASLLHDIGYLFFNYEKKVNMDSMKIFDIMFENHFILKYGGNLTPKSASELEALYDEFTAAFKDHIYTKHATALDLIKHLNEIPWLDSLIPGVSTGFDALRSGLDTGDELSAFAERIATTGYNPAKPSREVDHAVAGGLMLFKYTSIWYWIYENAKTKHPNLYEEFLARDFKYEVGVLTNHVIPACRALIYHNTNMKTKYDFNNEPLLYLAVLCDELQIWDRFMSGSDFISNWRKVKHCMAEQVYTEVVCTETWENQLHFAVSEDQHTKLSKKFNERLTDWEKIIKLDKIS